MEDSKIQKRRLEEYYKKYYKEGCSSHIGIAIIKNTRKTFLAIESTKGDGLRHLQV
jgi:hypothetical protein